MHNLHPMRYNLEELVMALEKKKNICSVGRKIHKATKQNNSFCK